jgi:hypothetical protein
MAPDTPPPMSPIGRLTELLNPDGSGFPHVVPDLGTRKISLDGLYSLLAQRDGLIRALFAEPIRALVAENRRLTAAAVVSPTDPAEIGAWLRALPSRSILIDRHHCAWQVGHGEVTYYLGDGCEVKSEFPALLRAGDDVPLAIETPEDVDLSADVDSDVAALAQWAPFTVLWRPDGA